MLPVAVALMTPIPLLIVFIFQKCFGKKEILENQDPATESMLKKNNESEITIASPISENEDVQT